MASQKVQFSECVIPACRRLRQHSAYVPAPACQRHGRRTTAIPAHTAMAGRSLAMAGRSTAGRNLMLSACYMGKISPWPRPWPRPGFSLCGIVQLLSRQGGPGFSFRGIVQLLSRQGGRFARNDKLLGLFTKPSNIVTSPQAAKNPCFQ